MQFSFCIQTAYQPLPPAEKQQNKMCNHWLLTSFSTPRYVLQRFSRWPLLRVMAKNWLDIQTGDWLKI